MHRVAGLAVVWELQIRLLAQLPATLFAVTGLAIQCGAEESQDSALSRPSKPNKGRPQRITILHRVMHHHGDMHQPPRSPCRFILGGVMESKMNGFVASEVVSIVKM